MVICGDELVGLVGGGAESTKASGSACFCCGELAGITGAICWVGAPPVPTTVVAPTGLSGASKLLFTDLPTKSIRVLPHLTKGKPMSQLIFLDVLNVLGEVFLAGFNGTKTRGHPEVLG